MDRDLLQVFVRSGPARQFDIRKFTSTIRTLPLHEQRLLFRLPFLNDSILFKTVLADDHNRVNPDKPIWTMVYHPYDAERPGDGGESFVFTEDTFASFTAYKLRNEALDCGAFDDDLRTLTILDSIPTFSPLMVELAFHRANATIPPIYLDLSPEVRTRLIGHLRNRIRPLILAAYSKSSVNTDRAVEVMTSRLLSLQDTGALLPLVQALRIPTAQAVDVLASWIGISYFEYEYAGIQSQLREFSTWMNHGALVREISSLTEKDYLERLVQFVRKRLKEDWARVVETSSAYRDTYQSLVAKGEIKGFIEFLLGCRRKYWMMGDTLGRFEQTANVWTSHKRQLLSQTMTARAMIAFFSILRNLYGAPPQASRTKLIAASPDGFSSLSADLF